MMRSMFAGVSGLRNHQTRMDVIGNNIANVNTIGFKAGRVNFQELFAQTLRGASRPLGSRGGTNPQQVGLGMALSSIDTIHNQGNSQTTGKMTDLAIQGNGFFVVSDGTQRLYTRAGAFDVDADGNLVDSTGKKVLGWTATAGVLPASNPTTLQPLVMKVGSPILAQPTTSFTYKGNLDANTAAASPAYNTSVTIFDSLGRQHTLTVAFTKTVTPNQWTYAVTAGATDIALTGGTAGTLQFTPTGTLQAGAPTNIPNITYTSTAAAAGTITPNFSAMSQLAGQTTATLDTRNGYEMGFLNAFTIDQTGIVTGTYSNNVPLTIGRIALANFNNPGGLIRQGEGAFAESNNSGIADIGEAGTGGRGTIAPSNVEMSNVDLAGEFTNMIVTQRGFQANTRVITASDQMLQDLVNLIR